MRGGAADSKRTEEGGTCLSFRLLSCGFCGSHVRPFDVIKFGKDTSCVHTCDVMRTVVPDEDVR